MEGDNRHSDWWKWEGKGALKYKSGAACRHYELFKSDFDLAKSLNHNAHRLSIEWGRVEPVEGHFSQEEIDHYVDVVDALRERGIEPIVTLHHFTNPAWFTAKGGWLHKDSREQFLRYTEKLVSALCGKVNFWVTINEPIVYSYHSYVIGLWPPQKKAFANLKKVRKELVSVHIAAYRLIHTIYQKRNLPSPRVGIAHNVQFFESRNNSLINKLAVFLRNRLYNFGIIDELTRAGMLDYIGLNYYTRSVADVKSLRYYHLLHDGPDKPDPAVKKNLLGWDIYPKGLYELCLRFKKYELPIYILENGICTDDDGQRWDYIKEHLKAIHAAIRAGVNISGYLYWSLLDNYEWHEGFRPRFGLIDVNYATFKRTVRGSAEKFALVCKSGELSQE